MSARYEDLCKKILALDKTIRFVGIADRYGTIIASHYREGLQPLLSKTDSERSVVQSAIRMSTRKTLESKLGSTVYSFTMYEKVKRTTIPIGGEKLLMVSFDVKSEHEQIILNRIVPLIKEYGPALRL